MAYKLIIKDLTDEQLNIVLDLLTEHAPKIDFTIGIDKQ